MMRIVDRPQPSSIGENMRDGDKLRALVAQLTTRPAADVELDSWPTQHGLDSLSMLIFREECERIFGVYIPDEDWAVMHNLNDILKFIRTSLSHASRFDHESISTLNARPITSSPLNWNSDDLIESLEIGMPLTGINQLSENALLKYLGDLRWRHMALESGVSSRNIKDASGNRLYPTFFYVELSFPIDRPMAGYGENDVFQIVDSVGRYGLSMLDGVAYLVPPEKRDCITRPLDGLADATSLGIPAVRISNIFVMKFNGAEWLKKGRPKDGLIDGIRELPSAPDSYAIVKQAEKDGYIDLPDKSYVPFHDYPSEYDYAIEPDRDVNGVGLLYFANYPIFLDLGERDALKRARGKWHDDLINKRTVINRKIAYLNNASWQDALKIRTRVWIKSLFLNEEGGSSSAATQIFSNQQMYRVSDGRMICVCSSHKLLYGACAEELRGSHQIGQSG
jgi:probable biosynthetic protein (TIGR04098 family)